MQMKHLVRNGVLVSSGPPNNNADMVNNNIDCIAIDVVSLDAGNLNVFTSVFGGYRSSASLSSKTIVIESFKPFQYYSSSRSLGITAVCSVANSLSIPWIVWQVSNDTSADPTAFSWTSDPSAWTALSLQAGNTTSNSA